MSLLPSSEYEETKSQAMAPALQQMMNNPLFYLGLGLLGTSRSKNPMSGGLLGLEAYNSMLKSRMEGQPKMYGSVIWGKEGDKGQLVPYQISQSGGAYSLGTGQPAGPNIQWERSPYEWLNLGSGYVPGSRTTGQPAGEMVPIELAPEKELPYVYDAAVAGAQGNVAGTKSAEAAAQMSETASKAQQMITLIDELLDDPATAQVTGSVQGRTWTIRESSKRAERRFNQLRGQMFAQVFESLRGGGHITEIETKQGKEGMSTLGSEEGLKMSDEAVRDELKKLRGIIENGLYRRSKGIIVPDWKPPGESPYTFNPQGTMPMPNPEEAREELRRRMEAGKQ